MSKPAINKGTQPAGPNNQDQADATGAIAQRCWDHAGVLLIKSVASGRYLAAEGTNVVNDNLVHGPQTKADALKDPRCWFIAYNDDKDDQGGFKIRSYAGGFIALTENGEVKVTWQTFSRGKVIANCFVKSCKSDIPDEKSDPVSNPIAITARVLSKLQKQQQPTIKGMLCHRNGDDAAVISTDWVYDKSKCSVGKVEGKHLVVSTYGKPQNADLIQYWDRSAEWKDLIAPILGSDALYFEFEIVGRNELGKPVKVDGFGAILNPLRQRAKAMKAQTVVQVTLWVTAAIVLFLCIRAWNRGKSAKSKSHDSQ